MGVLVTEQPWAGESVPTGACSRLISTLEPRNWCSRCSSPHGREFRRGLRTPRHPARIALPTPIGQLQLIDGALYDRASGDTLFAGEIEIDDV